MPALPIGTNLIKALDGSKVEERTWIEAETDKALLLKRKRVFFRGGSLRRSLLVSEEPMPSSEEADYQADRWKARADRRTGRTVCP